MATTLDPGTAADAVRPQGERPLAVFLVEDLRTVQLALTDLIESVGGLRVVGATSNEFEATSWILDHRGEWDIALLDLMLGDGTGFNLIQRVRRHHPEGRIVIVSEFASENVDERCRALGADAVFRKSEYPALMEYLQQVASGRDEPPKKAA